jgi:methionine synthase II (cobalamin-independent)
VIVEPGTTRSARRRRIKQAAAYVLLAATSFYAVWRVQEEGNRREQAACELADVIRDIVNNSAGSTVKPEQITDPTLRELLEQSRRRGEQFRKQALARIDAAPLECKA